MRPGKLVLVEGHALAQHQPVKVPAQAHRQVHRQRLVLHDGLQRDHPDAGHQHRRHPQQHVAALGPQPRGHLAAQPVDDAPEDREQRRLEGRHQRGERRHHGDLAAHAVRARPQEGQEALRRQRGFGGGVRG
jgi:hypothetical protein